MKRPWYVLHVKPRTEKKVEAYCRRYGCLAYLPLRARTRVIQRRRVHTEIPVFPGYVFARLSPDERLKMLQTNLLVHVLAPATARSLVHDLRQIARALRAAPDLVTTDSFRAGDRVRIVSGPFLGIEGVVRRSHGRAAIILNIELLNQALEISAPSADLQIVRKA